MVHDLDSDDPPQSAAEAVLAAGAMALTTIALAALGICVSNFYAPDPPAQTAADKQSDSKP